MIRVLIVGTGNVAQQLYRSWIKSTNVKLVGVAGRASEVPAYIGELPYTKLGDPLPESDVVVIAVSDDAIPEVGKILQDNTGALVVHTSGRTSMEALDCISRKGVFYPLQSFAPGRNINFNGVPLCLEAENDEDLQLLVSLGRTLGGEIRLMNSEDRAHLHLAAVMVNNFTNHLYAVASGHLEAHDLDFRLLLPLIRETTDRLQHGTPDTFQTGPALRGDTTTMGVHLDLLEEGGTRELYEKLSQSIQSYHGRKL